MSRIALTWIGQGGYLLACDGWRLAIDPYLSDALAARGVPRLTPPVIAPAALDVDLIACTHDHADHYDPETVPVALAASPRTILAGPASVRGHAARDGIDPTRIRPLAVGRGMQAGPCTIVPVPARHSDPDAVGLVVSVGGTAIWFSGDTTYDPALPETARAAAGGRLDGVVICINGKLNNMDAAQAMQCVIAARPAFAWPAHYGLFAVNTVDPAAFVAGVRAAGIRCQAPQEGTPYEL